MKDGHFCFNEICDGRYCEERDSCHRYMGNVDIDDPKVNLYVVFQTKPWPYNLCPYFLDEPHPAYPQLKRREHD